MEQDPFVVANHLVSEAVSARVNSDNTTVIIVCLNAGIEQPMEMASPSPTLEKGASLMSKANPLEDLDQDY